MENKTIKWYSINEIVSWLKKNKYSEKKANELEPILVNNFNSAFRKGFEVGLQNTIINISEGLPKVNVEVLLFVLEKNGAIRRTVGYRSLDKQDPENQNGWVMDWAVDGKIIAYSYLPIMS